MQTLQQLRSEVEEVERLAGGDYLYYQKQIHPIPNTEVIHRERFILHKCTDKVVLDVGCSGSPLHDDIKHVAKRLFGIDRVGEDSDTFWKMDFESPLFATQLGELPHKMGFPEIIICGEVLEHLSNPGTFLWNLRLFDCEIVVTVPNAFANYQDGFLRRGRENVNLDHVCWYSYRTFRTLVERHRFEIKEFYWADHHDVEPGFSEGLLFVIQKRRI